MWSFPARNDQMRFYGARNELVKRHWVGDAVDDHEGRAVRAGEQSPERLFNNRSVGNAAHVIDEEVQSIPHIGNHRFFLSGVYPCPRGNRIAAAKGFLDEACFSGTRASDEADALMRG